MAKLKVPIYTYDENRYSCDGKSLFTYLIIPNSDSSQFDTVSFNSEEKAIRVGNTLYGLNNFRILTLDFPMEIKDAM